ncbi:hypothetical protein SEVIR_9G270101v4 [Setaria viridis]|uniref:Alpha/beta hydrolase fold-3 domain-containing protein n=1 Tax=Setaria viridis TaxID=4556 RepID=A0A4U6T0N6_SETVI|nr:hypothetical protein SEVIR_9G270101v2 [Setaria viridis]
MDPRSEVILDYPIFRIYKDHHVDRLVGTETVPAGADAATGVVSKDVVIDDDSGIYVRLYLPDMAGTQANEDGPKLRVLVFFHGGGFITESAASPMYHNYVNSLAAAARVLVVSVNYRLAPEHRFPTGYEDSLRALKWALSGGDPWLSRHGDLGRVFLAGDSAGGNIIHNVAMMAAAAGDGGGVAARIEGAVLRVRRQGARCRGVRRDGGDDGHPVGRHLPGGGRGRVGRPEDKPAGRGGAEPAGPAVRETARSRGGRGLLQGQGEGVLRSRRGERVGRGGGVVRDNGQGARVLPPRSRLPRGRGAHGPARRILRWELNA